jgi:hypothetical protein
VLNHAQILVAQRGAMAPTSPKDRPDHATLHDADRAKICGGPRMDELPPLTPRMRRSLARALAIATENDQHVVGTEHVLLAFLDDRDGIAGMVLEAVGAADRVRAEVIRIVTSEGYKDPTKPGPPPFRAT